MITGMATVRHPRLMTILVFVALLMSVALLIRVAQGKRYAERSWSDLYERAMYAHTGMYVPTYSALATNGDSIRLGDVPPGTRQLLYFFTTTCPYCRASVPTWKALAEKAAGRSDVAVFGVAVDSSSALDDYLVKHGLTYPVVRMASARYARLFRAGGVPLTMVVDPGGQVSYARRGEFSSAILADSVLVALDRELPVPDDIGTATSVRPVSGS